MFDIGFWELMVIGILGLIVLGPERLPVAIRTIRSWISSAKNFSEGVKAELKEELRVNELHENLKKAEQSDLKNLSPEVAESLKSLKEAAEMVTRPYENSDTEKTLANPFTDNIKDDSTVKDEHKLN
jgi:sec-independent protein translocase protein TatB|tara:strand:+ start:188 stop:568 length:381 start_codon:yes stop_codon:yes gene_type:complete